MRRGARRRRRTVAAYESSHWHRIDASELWLHQAGGSLVLRTAAGGDVVERRLGPDMAGGELLQAVVAPGEWQAAYTNADWALVACVVVPGFEFAGFELAPPEWEPGRIDARSDDKDDA